MIVPTFPGTHSPSSAPLELIRFRVCDHRSSGAFYPRRVASQHSAVTNSCALSINDPPLTPQDPFIAKTFEAEDFSTLYWSLPPRSFFPKKHPGLVHPLVSAASLRRISSSGLLVLRFHHGFGSVVHFQPNIFETARTPTAHPGNMEDHTKARPLPLTLP